MRNCAARRRARGVCLWQLADAIGISEASMTRLLRRPLPERKRDELLDIVQRLAREEAQEVDA